MTVKKPGRPIFNHVLSAIERGGADGILVWDIDRLFRNPIDEGRVRWMLQQSIIISVRTPARHYEPADAGLLMAVEGGRAADYIVRLARNVKLGAKSKLMGGAWPGTQPTSYVYDHELRNIVPHPKEPPLVRYIFEQMSTGKYGLSWCAERLAENGIARKNWKRWLKSQVQRFLANKL